MDFNADLTSLISDAGGGSIVSGSIRVYPGLKATYREAYPGPIDGTATTPLPAGLPLFAAGLAALALLTFRKVRGALAILVGGLRFNWSSPSRKTVPGGPS
jgi:hypothetical protein